MAYIDTTLNLADFPVGESRCFKLNEAQIGIFHTRDGLFAIDNYCPHRGAPMHEGWVTDGYVTCPWHQWQFRLNDGVCLNIPKVTTPTFPVEVRNGAIWVDLPSKGANKS
jgi:NAD(P)H-dependent nitrite reductase small subunit